MNGGTVDKTIQRLDAILPYLEMLGTRETVTRFDSLWSRYEEDTKDKEKYIEDYIGFKSKTESGFDSMDGFKKRLGDDVKALENDVEELKENLSDKSTYQSLELAKSRINELEQAMNLKAKNTDLNDLNVKVVRIAAALAAVQFMAGIGITVWQIIADKG